jgi:hypothetical protein
MISNRAIWVVFVGIFLLSGLSCRSLIDFAGQAGSTRETAQAAISQAQVMATQSSLLLSTAQAFATQNPAVVGTAQAFINEQGPILLATAQALATENPGMVETAQAMIEQGLSGSEVPQGIPIPPSENDILISTSDTISLSTSMNLQEALGFYTTQMPGLGWTPVAQGTFETGNMAVLNYARPGETATISFTYSQSEGKTVILANVRRS